MHCLAHHEPGPMKLYLVRKVVRMEHDFHVARLANEGLGLLGLPAEHPRFPPIRDVRFRVPVHDLQRGVNEEIHGEWESVLRYKFHVQINGG